MSTPKNIALFGSHLFGYAALAHLLNPKVDVAVALVGTDNPHRSYCNPGGRLWRYGWDESIGTLVPQLAARAGIPAFDDRLSNPAWTDRLAKARIDGILTSCYGQRLPKSFLDFVGGRAFNIHPVMVGADLCDSRGPRALEIAACRGAKQLQLAVHVMTEEFDAGEIVARGAPVSMPDRFGDWFSNPESHLQEVQGVYRELSATTSELLERCLHSLFVAGSA